MDLENFTDVLGDTDEIGNSQPLSLSLTPPMLTCTTGIFSLNKPTNTCPRNERPARRTGQQGEFRSVEEIDPKYRDVFSYPYFNLVQSSVIDDALYTDKSMVVCAPTGSGKTVVFEMAIVQLLMELHEKMYTGDFKIIYMAPVKALCTERLSEWYPKFTKLGLLCVEVTGDTDVDFSQLKPYRIIITTPEKWDILTRRWRDHKSMVEVIKLFLIDEVHILNDESRGPVLEAVVSRMKTIESSSQSAHRIEQLQKQFQSKQDYQDVPDINSNSLPVRIRFVAVSATVSNPEDVAAWLGTSDKPAVYYKFGDECRPVKLKRVVEGYPCSEGTSIFKFDIILNYKLWPVIQKYHDGKPTLIFCSTRKSVALTAEALSRELTVSFTPEQRARLAALAATIKTKKLQSLVLNGIGCHHAGLLYEERVNIEKAFRNRDLPILITTTTLAMGVNLPAHLVIIKNTQQYVSGAYQEYSISTVLQMVGRAGRPQFDTEATAVIMTRLQDKPRYQALVGGDEPLQSYLHKRLAENLNSEAALGTVCDVAQCVQWLRSTFLSVRAAKDPKRYLGLPQNAQPSLISKKIEELCVKAMNGLATSGLITMDEASCIESTDAGRLMSVFYLDLETMKHIMKIEGTESLEKLLWVVCESHELADMHLRMDERRILNTLNRNNAAATIRFPMKGKINTRQMKLNCIIQAVLGCLPIPEPSLNQEAMKVMRITDRVCKCLVAYVTRPNAISNQPRCFTATLNALTLAKCVDAHLWENSPYVSRQLKGIGPTFSTLLASAGKITFTLLEESHPRDLERIMNKSTPAGNVLRKQVSLLPKYQLTATPLDEKRISIRLVLLNQQQLAENRDHLTAGDSHKCYIVVGDSENYLLLFTSFKDKDLISVYDGAITYEVTRKHSFEHKILIYCISSNWVGVDVNCDYLFKNIGPSFLRGEAINLIPIEDAASKSSKKQSNMTDFYQERKRKNKEIDVTESKEKKKRDTALVDKFKLLKNSFEVTSKELKKDLDKSAQISNMIINRMIHPNKCDNQNKGINNKPSAVVLESKDKNLLHQHTENNIYDPIPDTSNMSIENEFPLIDLSLDDEDNFMVDDRIDSILNEIETEIFKTNNPNPSRITNGINTQCIVQEKTKNDQNIIFAESSQTQYNHENALPIISSTNDRFHKLDAYSTTSKQFNEKRKRKHMNTKTNYSFMDTIEKNDASDDEDHVPQRDSGFSDTIKKQIEMFLRRRTELGRGDITIKELLESTESGSTETVAKNSGTESEQIVSELSEVNINLEHLDESAQTKMPSSQGEDVNKSRVTNKTSSNNLQKTGEIVEDIDFENVSTNELENILVEQTSSLEKTPNNFVKEIDDCKLKHYLETKNHEHEKSFYSENTKDNIENNLTPTEITIYNLDKHYEEIITEENDINVDVNKPDKIIHGTMRNHNTLRKNTLQTLCSNILETEPNDESNKTNLQNFPAVYGNNPMFQLNNKDDNCNLTFHDKETDDYINKYSFSATKIDECTKNSRDHQIKIIRKLKLDVEVTEIVSNKESNKCSTETKVSGKPVELEKYYHTKKENRYPKLQKYNVSSSDLMKQLQNFDRDNGKPRRELNIGDAASHLSQLTLTNKLKYETKPSQDIEELAVKNLDYDKIFLQKALAISMAGKHLTDSSHTKTATIEIENTKHDKLLHTKGSKQCFPQTDATSNKDMTIDTTNSTRKEKHSDKTNTEGLDQYKKYLREIAGASAAFKENIPSETEKNETISNQPTSLAYENVNTDANQKKSSNVESILQKYSTILRKDNILANSISEKNALQQDRSPQHVEKAQKPYKISDIRNLYIPLSKNFITVEASRLPRTTNDAIKKINDMEHCENFKITSKVANTVGNVESNATNFFEDNYPEDIPDYHSLVISHPTEELAADYNLDQSMLNPKTLLEQCYSKVEINDGEIIPPPSEFCDDENNYSLEKLEATSQEYSETERDLASIYTHDKTIFEEDSYSVLTPSTEIETWTLSRDEKEGTKNIHSQSMANKSCTVMHKKLDAYDIDNFSSSQNLESNSRKGKLGYFKFTNKKKLKM